MNRTEPDNELREEWQRDMAHSWAKGAVDGAVFVMVLAILHHALMYWVR